jgi:hypothetical protein
MARKSNEQIQRDVHADALAKFSKIQAALRDERLQCLQDRRFYSIAGAQWEGPLGEQFENKVRMEMNKIHLSVIRIFSEYRNNRITVDFQSRDGATDDKLADTCDGLYRADEKNSVAEEAYDNCFEEGVGGGFGAFRLRSDYEDEEDDENEAQRVYFEPIADADSSVFFDLNSKRYDKTDADHCFVLTAHPRQWYIDEYGDDPASWPKVIHQRYFDWYTPDVVYLAEYYQVEQVPEKINIYRGLDETDMRVPQSELDSDPEKERELAATGFRLVNVKNVKRRRIHKYLMSGSKIVEDCGLIAGRNIPIIPFYAKRWFVDNIERCMGHVRLAKDAQRLFNSLMSWLATMAARFDMEKPILAPEQIQGYAQMWADDNIEQYPYLLLNPLTDPTTGQIVATGPTAYTKAPNVPPAMAALMQLAGDALSELTGSQAQGEQIQPNISGKVVELIQQRLDMQVFIYMDNMKKTVRRGGEVWLSMMKDIAIEKERRMKVVESDYKTVSSTVLNRPIVGEDGEELLENDISKATFEVDVDVGPSSSSRRASTVRSLTALASVTQDPETQQILTYATIQNMEGEGLQDLRAWARNKAIRMGAVKPTDEEAQDMQAEQQNTPPDAQTQYLQAAAQQAEADAIKKRAETVETMASADLKRAQTVKTVADAHGQHTDTQINASEAIRRAALPPGSV